MNAERLTILFDKHLDNSLTPEEKQELYQLIQSTSPGMLEAALTEQLQQNITNNTPLSLSEAQTAIKALLSIDKPVPGNVSENPHHKISFLKRPWLRYAAAIIIVFGIGAYLFTTSNKAPKTASVQNTVKADLPPGGNYATLTLADGRKIILDSAANGAIASESGSQVIKKADGQLEYLNDKINNKEESLSYNSMSTPMGGQYQLKLPDGSLVWLNAASKITFPTHFTGSDRLVHIEGEAWFDIAKNTKQPFKVKVRDITVQVLGTQFNVNAYGDEAKVSTTLLQGSVLVQNGIAIEKLKPGQQANLSKQGELEVLQNVNTDAVMAWKNGYISFDNHSLEANLKQLARWYDLQILFVGKMPSIQLVGKVDKRVPLSDVLHWLSAMNLKTKLEPPNKLTILE